MQSSHPHVHPNHYNPTRRLYRYRVADWAIEDLSPDDKAILGRSKHVYSHTSPREFAGGVEITDGHYKGSSIFVRRSELIFHD